MRVHLRFSEKDRDLCSWRHSIKRNMLTFYICQILRAEMVGKIAFVPNLEYMSADTSPCDVFMVINDAKIEEFIKAIPEYRRNSKIKFIVRKHLYAKIDAVKVNDQNNVRTQTGVTNNRQVVRIKTENVPVEDTTPEENEKVYIEPEEDRAAILALIAMGGE